MFSNGIILGADMRRIALCLLTVMFNLVQGRYQFLSAVTGDVLHDNYTYYTLTYDGTILLELTSTSGDCDLYVSQNTMRPTYDTQNNCLQSATCGLDAVMVPKSFRRPLGIGIFGHPSHEVSQFILTISRVDDSLDVFHFDSYTEWLQMHYFSNAPDNGDKKEVVRHNVNKGHNIQDNKENNNYDEEEGSDSLYWVMLKSFLTYLLENIIL